MALRASSGKLKHGVSACEGAAWITAPKNDSYKN
jgi:hypothetical protein